MFLQESIYYILMLFLASKSKLFIKINVFFIFHWLYCLVKRIFMMNIHSLICSIGTQLYVLGFCSGSQFSFISLVKRLLAFLFAIITRNWKWNYCWKNGIQNRQPSVKYYIFIMKIMNLPRYKLKKDHKLMNLILNGSTHILNILVMCLSTNGERA